MKSNDDIPQDEMLLAEAIAAAKAKGLQFSQGARFRPITVPRDKATACCVLGALELAGQSARDFGDAWMGNDADEAQPWGDFGEDGGVSLGWAFRQAMTVDE